MTVTTLGGSERSPAGRRIVVGSGAGRAWWALPAVLLTLALAVGVAGWPSLRASPSASTLPPGEPAVAGPGPAAALQDTRDQSVVAAPTPQASPALPGRPAPPAPTRTPDARAAWSRESSFNFMALGVDQRLANEIPRTDTIMLGSVDLGRRRLSLVSVPRDLLVEIPGHGQDRINAAYVYGEQFKERDGGIGLLRRTIERNFGITVQHYGLIDFQCFRTAVEAVGPLTVDVPRPIVDTQYPTDDYGFKTVRFDAGPQRMDGERALEYVRTRHADSDFNRMRRQQQVVAALRQQLLQLRSLPAIPTIMAGCRNLRSDLGFFDYLGMPDAVRQLGDGDVSLRAIDESMVVDAYASGGAAVLLPRWEPIRALVRDTFPATTLTASLPRPAH